jgi:two-component system chemotaxis sensor kinase CheA
MSKTILVVDDEQAARDFVVMAAEAMESDFAVETAVDAQDAVNKLNSKHYDALILDVSLPVINGNILAVFVRKAFPKMPIAFLTNYDSESAKQTAEEQHSEYWSKIEKMSKFDVLHKCMNNLLNGLDCSGKQSVVAPNLPEGTGVVEIPDEFKVLLNG